jgi:hypothetical protein
MVWTAKIGHKIICKQYLLKSELIIFQKLHQPGRVSYFESLCFVIVSVVLCFFDKVENGKHLIWVVLLLIGIGLNIVK